MDEFEKEELLRQIKNDTHFLRKHGLMDYSLFVKIENVDSDSEGWAAKLGVTKTLVHNDRAVSYSARNNFNKSINNVDQYVEKIVRLKSRNKFKSQDSK